MIIASVLLYFWHMSGQTIISSANTVYPGDRDSIGGGMFWQLFRYGASLFLPITGENLYPITVEPEMAQIFILFPIGAILSIYVLIKEKKKDRLLIVLLIMEVLLVAYCAIPFPTFLAKITLLNRSTSYRVILAIGYLNIIQIGRAIAVNTNKVSKKLAIIFAVIFASVITVMNNYLCAGYMTKLFNIILWTVVLLCIYFIIRSYEKYYKRSLIIVMSYFVVLTGIVVNPIQIGCEVIYKNELVKNIYEISKEDDGLWFVEGNYPLINVPIMVGAPTINCTNVYPDLDKWRLVDTEEKYVDVYNRYAHINAELTDEPTEFVEGITPDTFLIRLNFEDLKILNVKYLLSQNDYTDREEAGIEKISQVGNFYIYQIEQ